MANKPITIKVNRPDPRKLPDIPSVFGRHIYSERGKLFSSDYDIPSKLWRIVLPSKGGFQPLPDFFTEKIIGKSNSFSTEQGCRSAIYELTNRTEEKWKLHPLVLIGVRSITLKELFQDELEKD